MKITTKILVACLPGIVTGALFAATTGERAVSKPNESAMSKVKSSLGKLPLSFEPNRGQTDPRVQFLTRGPGFTVFFTDNNETVISLKDTTTSNAVVRMKFVGGATSATPHPIDALPGKSNYLIGNDSSKWLTGIDEYTKLRYENVYPGIDVLYQGVKDKNLRYDFIVKPGADARAIQMAYEGADKVFINKDGDLALTIDGKTLVTTKPFTYQEDGGAKKEVASHFAIKDGRVSFELAKYDTTKDLVIDPGVIFITYLGGLLNDSVNAVAIANPTLTITSAPSAYFVTGTTNSTNFPTTTGVVNAAATGAGDVFVTKISFTGSQILWSTYLGGNNQDSGAAVAVDSVTANCQSAGCPIVVGQTFSANFPTSPFQAPPLSGANDAFAAKLNATGTALIYSTYIGGLGNDFATGVAIDLLGNIYVGGYTDSPSFPTACPTSAPPNSCTNQGSSDAFVVKIPASYSASSTFGTSINSNLYGGFGEEYAHAIAYNATSNMVYLAGDTTTASQNFITPNNKNLPGITNNTVNTGLPGPGPNARGGFVVAFDAATLVRTFASYVAASPANGTCGTAPNTYPCNHGWESITGIASEGGALAGTCSPANQTCSVVGNAGAGPISTAYGNVGHIYLTGYTTSVTPSAGIAYVAPSQAGFSCASPIAASSVPYGGPINGPSGTPVVIPGGTTIPAGCTPALYTQTPFATNQAVVYGCPFPLPTPFIPTPTCNLAAYVSIMDGALLAVPVTNAPTPTGNQIEYWAYYSSPNSSTVANAIAIDSNPTTLSSVFSLGTYQQMYITGYTEITVPGAINALPVTNGTGPTEIFTSYNVGTTTGGGVGGLTPIGASLNSTLPNEIDAFVARFNANGLAAVAYGGVNQGVCNNGVCPVATVAQVANDRSPLIHTPQFNYGEFLYSQAAAETSNGSTPSTIGNSIAVDPTRAVIIGGATNVTQAGTAGACTVTSSTSSTNFGSCQFTTTNALPATGLGPDGGNDGWVSVLFFNDILSNAGAQASANPWLQPPAGPQLVTQGISYIETTPAPFGPTFDFAISDLSTQTQTFQVLFTGQAAGQLQGTTPWFVPLDPRSGATQPTIDNNLPGAGIVYYLPCVNPSQSAGTLSPASLGYYNNGYPAPGGAYGPLECAFPSNDLYENIPMLYSGYPGLSTLLVANGTYVTPGWLLVSQDVSPGVVRLQLDRRAAAGLLEGTYIAQFLVTTYDSQHNTQWPPCGPGPSVQNPFVSTANVTCTNASTPLPADNVSILVTVRLVVRPTLFLSRNSGILTGVTSSLSTTNLFGPSTGAGSTTLTGQQGTSPVPDWLYTGTSNNSSTWPGTGPNGLGTIFTSGTNGVNSGPAICTPGSTAATSIGNTNLNLPAAVINGGVTVPCPITAAAPATTAAALWGASAYALNGPGDLSGGLPSYSPGLPNLASVPTAATPSMTFLYDAGTILTQTSGPLTGCSITPCNLSVEQGLSPIRPDQPLYAGTAFNGEWQGGQDPLTQRNDATVHDYYVTAEGQATLSVAAINCTHWAGSDKRAEVGNWLAVEILDASKTPDGVTKNYTPICSDATVNGANGSILVGTAAAAKATYCNKGCTFGTGIGDDSAVPPAVGGQKIVLDFLTLAYSNRKQLNGIPTGLYTAQVYVWSTRAKNSVPGYCLGASMPASNNGVDPTPLCGAGSSSAIASSSNPYPLVPVTAAQTFNVSLMVFDTTQIIQLTPNTCPTGGIITGNVTEFATVANPENLFTGNIIPPFGPGALPNYPNFGQDAGSGQQLVEWSLLPFQTTGQATTQSNNSLTPIPLPQGVTVNAQTLAQYNACSVPTGTFGGTAITGASVPGIGYLTQTGPLSQTTFVPVANATNNNVTIYACRPTVTPAWLNSPLYPGNTVFGAYNDPLNANATVEPYANGNGPNPVIGAVTAGLGPVPSVTALTCGLSATATGTGGVTVFATSKIGVFRPGSSNGSAFLLDSTGANAYVPGSSKFIQNFFGPGPNSFNGITSQAGDIGVSGDWTGDGHYKVGVYRPSTGQWFLDINNDGLYDAGDATYSFGGLTAGGNVDTPVVGDWTNVGKSCIGINRNGSSGMFWLLDLNCNGTFDNTPSDAFFPFGGLSGDVPVVGAWTGLATPGVGFKVGVVRKYAPGGVPVGNPFFWVLDNGSASAGNTPANHPPAAGSFPFGGLAGDIFVTGDWLGTGVWHAAVYRTGSWIEDTTGAHTYDTFFQFGGLATDTPVVGKW